MIHIPTANAVVTLHLLFNLRMLVRPLSLLTVVVPSSLLLVPSVRRLSASTSGGARIVLKWMMIADQPKLERPA